MSVFLSLSHTHTHLCSNTHRPTRSLQRVLPDSDLLCTVQSSVYESLTTTERLQHVASVYSRYSSLVLLEANATKFTFTVQAAELAYKLLMADVEFWINSAERRRMQTFRKIHTYVAWCDRLCAAASLHPEGCSTGFSVSDPLLENTDLSSPAALASLSSIPAGGSREAWGSDKICRSRSYSPITLGSFQICNKAVVGDAFVCATVYSVALHNFVQKYRHCMNWDGRGSVGTSWVFKVCIWSKTC